MQLAKTLKIALPVSLGRELTQMAKEEHQSLVQLLGELSRQYRSQRNLSRLSNAAQKLVKAKGFTEENFGGPFEE